MEKKLETIIVAATGVEKELTVSHNTDVDLNEVESIKDLKKDKESLKFKPSFLDLIETGRISEKLYLLFDYKRGKYLLIDKETGDREVMNKEEATHKIFELFLKAGIELKNPSSDLKYVKKVYVVFDIQQGEKWNTNIGEFLNEFNEAKTKLGDIRKIRENSKQRYVHITILKSKCKAIFALLMNLFEEDEDAVDHFINYLSTFVNTRKKIPTTFMFAGIEGAGKGVLYKILQVILGKEYSTEQNASNLKSDFNDSFENKLLVNLNEVSTDFSKTDTAIQKLKSLITDDTFHLNCKNQKAFDAKNYSLILLSTQHKHSIKMSMTDRRYNFFIQERTLRDVAEKDFKMDVVEFSEVKVMNEVNDFVNILSLYNFDKYRAQTIYQNNSKKRVQLATSNAFDIMLKYLKDKDLESIDYEISEVISAYNDNDDKSKYSDNYRLAIHNAKTGLINDIELEFEKDFISNKSLSALYDILVEDTKKKEDRVLNKIYESNFGKSIVKNVEGTNKRGRSILSDKELKKIEKEEEEKDMF